MYIGFETPILELAIYRELRLSAAMAQKLAAALCSISQKDDISRVTVEDLLNYLPTRYEDRSNLVQIDELEEDMQAAVEITVKVAGAFPVGKNRSPRRSPLYMFEISGS